MSKGYSQYEAAAILQCSQETICKDVTWLREYYKQQMHQYISEELRVKWNETMTLLMSTIRAISRIAEDPFISIHEKLHCYDLLNDCVEIRRDMLSDPTIIEANSERNKRSW